MPNVCVYPVGHFGDEIAESISEGGGVAGWPSMSSSSFSCGNGRSSGGRLVNSSARALMFIASKGVMASARFDNGRDMVDIQDDCRLRKCGAERIDRILC